MKTIIIAAITLSLSSCSKKITTAEVVESRLIPFVTANGAQAQMVLINWKNTGTTPIRVVHANIIAYDSNGVTLSSSANDYTIYAVSDERPGISSNRTYIEPDGEGFVLLPLDGSSSNASRVEAQITRVVETSGF